MVRRAYAQSGERQHLADRLRWHIQEMLYHGRAGAVLALRPIAQSASCSGYVVGFDPVVERIQELIRKTDVLEVTAEDGIGIVLPDTESTGARAVFLRLRDALCTPIPPDMPHEMSIAVAFGYAASSAFPCGAAHAGGAGRAAHADADSTVSLLDATTTAMLDAAWQPRIVLSLTLPVVAQVTQLARRTRARREQDVEGERALPGDRTKRDAPRPSEQSMANGDASGGADVAAEQHVAQRGHLRLVASQPMGLPEFEALRALARTMGVPFVRMPAHLPRACRTALQPAVACELRAVPIGRTRGTLTLAMHDPGDTEALQRVRALTGLSIFPVLAAPDEIDRALRQIMGR